jgi:hypothetical protein
VKSATRVSEVSGFIVLLALVVAPIWAFAGMMEVSFHADESVYIYMARYFDLFFLKRDFSNPEWDAEVVWSVTQPPVSKYVIGLGLFATGHDFSAMHNPWKWSLDEKKNFERGNVPSASALFVSRAVMTCLFTLSIVLCAAIAYRLSGFIGAFVAGPIFAASGLSLQFLRRATADPPLVFFGLLTVVSSMKLLRSMTKGEGGVSPRTFFWAALTGIWLGLTGGSKPSGAALIPVVLLAPTLAWTVHRSEGTRRISGSRLLALYVVVLAAVVLSFVLPNPMLYADPWAGINAMIDHRVSAANIQQEEAPEQALTTIPARMRATLDRVFHPVGAVVFLFGLGLLAWQEFRDWARRAVTERTVVLLWVAGTLAFTVWFTPMNWGRYFVLLVPCQAVVVGYLAAAVVDAIRKRQSPSPARAEGQA